MNTDNILKTDSSAEHLPNNCDNLYEYSSTNIWNSAFTSPEISCDLLVLHKDLQEIKTLVGEIRNCLTEFFGEK